MGGQILIRRGGAFVPVLGGASAQPVAATRQDLVPGTYTPDASTTGLLPGYTWTTAGIWFNGALLPGSVINGDYAPTTTDTLMENKVINGRFMPNGVRNTLRNCVIRGSAAGPADGAGQSYGLVQVGASVQDARIEDCLLLPQHPHYNMTGCYSHDYTALRLNVSRTVDGFGAFKANAPCNVHILACYVHDLNMVAPDPNHPNDALGPRTHNDGVQIQGGDGVEINGCAIEGIVSNFPASEGWIQATMDVTTNPPNVWAPPHKFSASGRCLATSCIIVTPNVGTPKISANHRIVNNLLIGGAAGGINYANVSGGAIGSQGDAGFIDGNRFDHWSDGPGAPSGTNPNNYTIRVGQVWTTNNIGSNNLYYDTLAPVVVRIGLVGN